MKSLKERAALEVAKLWKEKSTIIHDDCNKELQNENSRHSIEEERHMKAMKAETRLHRENIRMVTINHHKNLLIQMNVHEKFHSDILQKTLQLFRSHRTLHGQSYICYNYLGKIYVDERDGQLIFLLDNELANLLDKYGLHTSQLNIYSLFMAKIELRCTPTQMSLADKLFMF